MAKLISGSALRSSFSKLPAFTTTAMWMGSCLLGGFALGSKVHNPLKTTTVHFEKVVWISNQEPVQLAKIDTDEFAKNELKISLDFKPFELPARKEYRLQLGKKTSKRRVNSWSRLDHAIKNLKLTSLAQLQQRLYIDQETLLVDYSSALRELRRDFMYSMIPTLKSDEIRTMVSSAEAPAQVIEVQYGPANKPIKDATSAEAKMDIQTVSIHKNNNNPEPISNLGISERATAARYQPILQVVRPVAKKKVPVKRQEIAVTKFAVTKSEATVAQAPQAAQAAEAKEAEVRQLVQINALTGRDTTARIPDAPVDEPLARMPQNKPEFTTYFNNSLSKEDQKVLTEAMLNEQTKALNGVVVPTKTAAGKAAVAANVPLQTPATQPQKTSKSGFGEKVESPDEDETVPEAYEPQNPETTQASTDCAQLKHTRFINTLGNQICPTNHAWISKNWAGSGWIKVENEHSPNLLTYYPSPNTGNALVMDTNSVALLGLTSGAKVMSGMGVITGLVPDGFEVEFAGRAEEPEYFMVQGKHYFAIINAEPGAGVIQLVSKQNQEQSATVFAPVMEDTITYLDLAAPKKANFTVKVLKNGGADPEVAGLTVGISTGGKIQGITQSQGRAFLRDVPIVPGYPVYVDVSSKMKNERGYMYRYLLKNRNRAGDYVVYQVSEKNLFSWIKQVKQGLSEQSAMVVGFFNRKHLGGFKEHYFAKAIPQTARFGLDPRNFSVLWNGEISPTEPLEGDLPRFMSVQVPEGLTQLKVTKESGEAVISELIPVSPRVIHVVSE